MIHFISILAEDFVLKTNIKLKTYLLFVQHFDEFLNFTKLNFFLCKQIIMYIEFYSYTLYTYYSDQYINNMVNFKKNVLLRLYYLPINDVGTYLPIEKYL